MGATCVLLCLCLLQRCCFVFAWSVAVQQLWADWHVCLGGFGFGFACASRACTQLYLCSGCSAVLSRLWLAAQGAAMPTGAVLFMPYYVVLGPCHLSSVPNAVGCILVLLLSLLSCM